MKIFSQAAMKSSLLAITVFSVAGCGLQSSFDKIDSNLAGVSTAKLSGAGDPVVGPTPVLVASNAPSVGPTPLAPVGGEPVVAPSQPLPNCTPGAASPVDMKVIACGIDSIKICHIPPGNPAAQHTLCIAMQGAVNGHGVKFNGEVGGHGGDYPGECKPLGTPAPVACPSSSPSPVAVPNG